MSGVPFKATAVDIALGRILCLIRMQQNLMQRDVARACGVTFQQIQKYETASNRIAASQLLNMASGLGVPVECFFNKTLMQAVCDDNLFDALKNFVRLSDDNRALVLDMLRVMIGTDK